MKYSQNTEYFIDQCLVTISNFTYCLSIYFIILLLSLFLIRVMVLHVMQTAVFDGLTGRVDNSGQ